MRPSQLRSETGATAVEYGIMVALIAAVIISAVVAVGLATEDAFQCTADRMADSKAACD